MELQVYRHLWGVEGRWQELFPAIRELGYEGIETHVQHPEQTTDLGEMLEEHGFRFIAMIFTEGDSVKSHLRSFREQLDEVSSLNPVLVTCHSGRDWFSDAEAKQFYEEAMRVEADLAAPVAHETHRGRVFFNPWTTARALESHESLKLCCDFSHWVCVCERLIDDQEDIIRACAERTIHLHARVGYEEGPQVPDPRAPEYERHLLAHEKWWDMIWEAQKRQNHRTSTLTPEFGPPAYLHTLPYTNTPVADLWDICNWQADRQRRRFARRA